MIQTLVLGYLLSLISKAAPYLASIFDGTFPHVLRTEIEKPNSDAVSSGKNNIPLGCLYCLNLPVQVRSSGGKGLLPKANPLMNGTGNNLYFQANLSS